MKPIDYFNDAWTRCDELRVLSSFLRSRITPALSVNEMLRAEWVARVSALDLFVHELVLQRMVEIFSGSRPACDGFDRFGCTLSLARRLTLAQSDTERILTFNLEVKSKLNRMTFQNPDDIANGIRFVSNVELWKAIVVKRGFPQNRIDDAAKELKRRLSLIVDRRNKIVHEADLVPSVPRTPWPISRDDVDETASLIDGIVSDISEIVV